MCKHSLLPRAEDVIVHLPTMVHRFEFSKVLKMDISRTDIQRMVLLLRLFIYSIMDDSHEFIICEYVFEARNAAVGKK